MSTVSQRPSTFCLKRGLHVPRWAGEPRVFSPLQHRNHKHRLLWTLGISLCPHPCRASDWLTQPPSHYPQGVFSTSLIIKAFPFFIVAKRLRNKIPFTNLKIILFFKVLGPTVYIVVVFYNVYRHIHMLCTCTYVWMHVNMDVCTYLCICNYVYICTCIHRCMYMCIQTWMHVYKYVYTCVCTQICICMYVYIYKEM